MLTTFHSRLVALLPAAIASALGPDLFPGGAAAVFPGRRAPCVQADHEVQVEQLGREPGVGAYRDATVHRYRLHVAVRGPAGALGTGKVHADAIDELLAGLEQALATARPFQPDLPEVLSAAFRVEAQDVEPDDEGLCEGRALLTIFTRGTGDLTGAETPGG